MGTAAGAIIGVVATIIVAHYYFRRTVSKSLGVYGLLNSYVFAGIAADVRRQLHFRFQDREVHELQQLVFLVANDGEKAIRDVLEPLQLAIPPEVEVLDASIIHRRPDGLGVDIGTMLTAAGGSEISFRFPLLNKGEFFVVKLLLSGQLSIDKVRFAILAEDLPRSLTVRATPPTSVQDTGYKIDWTLAAVSAVILLFVIWVGRWLYVLRQARPELFPLPWPTFHVSAEALFLIVPGSLFLSALGIIGLLMFGAAVFGGDFPPSRGPRFPLPKELREAVFPYQLIGDLGLTPTGWAEPLKDAKPGTPYGEEGAESDRGDEGPQKTRSSEG